YDSSDKFSSSEGRLVRILKTGIGGSQFFAPEINPNQSLYEFFPATKEWIWHKNDGHRIYYSTGKNATIFEEEKFFKWFPTKTEDSSGNIIRYFYFYDLGTPYLERVEYAYKDNIPHYFLEFTYQDRETPYFRFNSTFKVGLGKICSQILVKSSPDHLVRSYQFNHTGSYLRSIKMYGENGQEPLSPLPPISFSYYEFNDFYSKIY